MTKQAAIYARVSTDEQSKGYSLSTQVDACQDYAVQRGYMVMDIFKDDYSGAAIDRPGLNQLRELVAEGTLDVVIVYDIDRLARKSVYQMLIEEELKRSNVTVEYVLGQYDDTDEGRLQKQIRASIAEYEKAKILERSKRGKRGKAKSGFVLVGARPPYGYRVLSEPHKSWLVVEEDEARVVQMVFQWFNYGDEFGKPLSINRILVKLIAMGIPTRGDKEEHVAKKREPGVWSDAMIRHILKNETYTGIWHFGKTKMVNDGKEHTRQQQPKRGLGKQVPRPREEWIEVTVPAIISPDDFTLAQARLQLNIEQSRRNTKREYLLSRRLRCAKCGYTFVGITRREKHRYYRCNGAWRTAKVCDMPHFRVDDVDNAVWTWLEKILLDSESLSAGLRETQEEKRRSSQALYDRLEIIAKRIAETERQIEKLLDLYLTDGFPKEMLQERKSRLEETILNLRREQAELSVHLQSSVLTDEQIADIESFCAEIRTKLDITTFEDKRHILDLLDLRGTLAIENDEKVVYIKCRVGQPRVSVARTSHLSNIGVTATTACASLPTVLFQ